MSYPEADMRNCLISCSPVLKLTRESACSWEICPTYVNVRLLPRHGKSHALFPMSGHP